MLNAVAALRALPGTGGIVGSGHDEPHGEPETAEKHGGKNMGDMIHRRDGANVLRSLLAAAAWSNPLFGIDSHC